MLQYLGDLEVIYFHSVDNWYFGKKSGAFAWYLFLDNIKAIDGEKYIHKIDIMGIETNIIM